MREISFWTCADWTHRSRDERAAVTINFKTRGRDTDVNLPEAGQPRRNSLSSSITAARLTPLATSVTTRGMSDASEPKALLPYGAQKYENRYSEERFWEKVRRFAKVAGKRVVETALQLYFSAQSPQTPARAKSVIYGALAYFILPIDIIPDLLPGVGYTDDLTVLLAAIGIVASHITPKIKREARNKAAAWFSD